MRGRIGEIKTKKGLREDIETTVQYYDCGGGMF
jgi:hypothetical protein